MRHRLARLGAAIAVGVLSLTFTATALANWSSQSAGTGQYLNNVRFAGADRGWTVGASGTLLATTDGGATWTAQTSGTSYDLCGVDAVSTSTAWVVGDHGTILKTTDGGASWDPQTSGTTQMLLAVDFIDASTGYISGDGGTVLKTVNGGATWTAQDSHESSALSAVSFRNATHGVMSGDLMGGGNGRLRVTSDGGATWASVTTPAAVMMYDVQYLDATHAWAVGENGTVLKSTDDAQTWTAQQTNSHYALDAVSFVDASTGWAIGSQDDRAPFRATIIKSTDGGATWTPEATTSIEYLYGVHAVSTTTAYASGSAGTILKQTSGGGGEGDTTPPVTTDNAPTSWVDHAVTVTLTATDDSSGVATTEYKIDGASSWTTYTAPFTISADGDHTVLYRSIDNENNAESQVTIHVKIDTAAPATTHNAPAGWKNTAQTVTLTPSDVAGSGVVTTKYKIDAGSYVTGTSVAIAAPADHSNDGVHTITYYSQDEVGNEEATKTAVVRIDTTAPTTTDDAPAGTITSAATITLTPADAGSGVANTSYRLDGGQLTSYAAPIQVSANGAHSLVYSSTDQAGNQQAEVTRSFTLDLANNDVTPPQTTAGQSPQAGPSGWTSADQVTVTLTAADEQAGSGVATTNYAVDGGAQQTYGAPFSVSGQGAHTITYWSVDVADNSEGQQTLRIDIDTAAPLVVSDSDGFWHNSDVEVSLVAVDANAGARSGVASVQYRPASSGPWTTVDDEIAHFIVAAPADGTNDGVHSIEYRAVDVAGNTSATRTTRVRIDTKMPNTVVAGLPDGWTNKAVTLTYTAHPGAGAPIVTTEYSLDGGATWTGWPLGTALNITQPGVTSIAYRSTNEAGTREATRVSEVRIDAVTPLGTALKNVSVARNKTATLSFTVKDATPSSGTARVTISIMKGKTVKKKIVLQAVVVNATAVYKYKATLPKGLYTWTLKATDAAGNVQLKSGVKKLTVR
jgi:photosystem II stability/assembly factor-like uncharacterized protein